MHASCLRHAKNAPLHLPLPFVVCLLSLVCERRTLADSSTCSANHLTGEQIQKSTHLLGAKDKVGDVDELLQATELLGGVPAGAGLEAAAHDAAADIDVHGRRVLVGQAERLLERPYPVCLIPPGMAKPLLRIPVHASQPPH